MQQNFYMLNEKELMTDCKNGKTKNWKSFEMWRFFESGSCSMHSMFWNGSVDCDTLTVDGVIVGFRVVDGHVILTLNDAITDAPLTEQGISWLSKIDDYGNFSGRHAAYVAGCQVVAFRSEGYGPMKIDNVLLVRTKMFQRVVVSVLKGGNVCLTEMYHFGKRSYHELKKALSEAMGETE